MRHSPANSSDILIKDLLKALFSFPPLFTPAVNLYNAVKDCFTHLDYTISPLQQQTGMCQALTGVERSGGLATSLAEGRCSEMAAEGTLTLLECYANRINRPWISSVSRW